MVAEISLSTPNASLRSGTYHLVPIVVTKIAKMDVWTVEVRFISSTYGPMIKDCKERT